jgi:hypothetical protein
MEEKKQIPIFPNRLRRFRYAPVRKKNKYNVGNRNYKDEEGIRKYDQNYNIVDYKENFINLMIQLTVDNITKPEFFRMVMYGYLERDKDILSFIERKKEEIKVKKAYTERVLKEEERRMLELGDKLNVELTKDEIEDIFDLIEMDLNLDNLDNIEKEIGKEEENKK